MYEKSLKQNSKQNQTAFVSIRGRHTRFNAWSKSRVAFLSLLLFSVYNSLASVADAAPDDRGAMGGVYGLGLGGAVFTGTDDQGARLSSQYGGSVHLMLGEEVLPKLFVGIGVDAHIDTFGSTQSPL